MTSSTAGATPAVASSFPAATVAVEHLRSSPMSWVPTGRYSGAAEVLVDGDKVADVTIELRGRKRVLTSGSLAGGEQPVEGGSAEIDGRIVSADRSLRDLHIELLQMTFTLRTPDGREARAFLRNDRGTLGMASEFPFDA